MAGEFDVSWGNFDEYFVEEVETSKFPEISEVCNETYFRYVITLAPSWRALALLVYPD